MADETLEQQFWNMIFFGEYGSGKTGIIASAVSAPEIFLPGLLMNLEGGVSSVLSKIDQVPFDRIFEADFTPSKTKLTSVRIKKMDQVTAILDLLEENADGYKLAAADSLSEINQLNLTEAIAYNWAMKVKLCNGTTPQLPDFGRNSSQMRGIIRRFRDLPMHTIFTALPKRDKDEKSGLTEIKPLLTGQLDSEVPGMVDIVGWVSATKNKGERLIDFEQTDVLKVKDRSEGEKLGRQMIVKLGDPTLSMIIDKLNG